jgi:hypothetical protein
MGAFCESSAALPPPARTELPVFAGIELGAAFGELRALTASTTDVAVVTTPPVPASIQSGAGANCMPVPTPPAVADRLGHSPPSPALRLA